MKYWDRYLLPEERSRGVYTVILYLRKSKGGVVEGVNRCRRPILDPLGIFWLIHSPERTKVPFDEVSC